MPSCWSCGAELPYRPLTPIPRSAECPSCGGDLHACRNCRHHDPAVNNQCREPNAEWISDRERANFCELFQLADRSGGAGDAKDRAAEARKKLDDLFGGPR
ncbi:MAG: hypothetical protein GF346_04115 [Candidatus Eisenbacteria bacterium]|nr:hypothetical protein [Candidatus Latescibacterota bacterium]MBD3301611.1 hypothetical protein [Candidatus Eisenbacteria bacterium]